MAEKKQRREAFTSFRILGKKAQNLLLKAHEMKKKQVQATAEETVAEDVAAQSTLRVEFSLQSVALSAMVIILVAVGAWIVYALTNTIILLLLGFFVAAIMDPGIRWLERMGFPRGIAVLLHYFVALFVFLFLLISLIPIIAQQIQQIAILLNDQANLFLAHPQISLPFLAPDVNERLTQLVTSTLEDLSIQNFTAALASFGNDLSGIAQNLTGFATQVAGSVLGFFVNLIIVLVLAFFIQVEKEHIHVWVSGFLPGSVRLYLDRKTEAVHYKIGQWARGQILLGLSIGSLVFIALVVMGMPYATTLAVLAGFTEFIPYLGPFIAAVPAILIAFTQGGWVWALIVMGVYYVIQWCENNLLVPLIMKRAVGLSPIAIMFAMLAGFSFPTVIHPILGLLLAVPVTTILTIFLEDWRSYRKKVS